MAYRKRRGGAASNARPTPSGTHKDLGTELVPIVLAIAQQLKQLQADMESVKKRVAALEAQAATSAARPAPIVDQAREVVQTLQSIFGAGQNARSATTSAPSPTARPAVPQPSTKASSVPPESAASSPAAPTLQQAPWMVASSHDPSQLVPQWTLWSAEFLNEIDTLVASHLDSIPDILAKLLDPRPAEKMRLCFASDKPTALQIASLVARRIVAVSPAARATAQQRIDLVQLAVRSLEDSLPAEAEVRQRFASLLKQEPHLPLMLGMYLTVALQNFEGKPVR